jgi:hypothetical protein
VEKTMRFRPSLATAGLGVLVLAGCTDTYARRPATSETTTVVRDANGNPLSTATTVRDANGNVVATGPSAAPGYSGSSTYPGAYPGYPSGGTYPAYPRSGCEPSVLHQDRPGGSDYDPRRGAPSC